MTAAKWKMSKTKAWVLFTLWAFVIVFVSAFFLAGPAVLQSYDDAHHVQLSCVISSAEASSGSTRSAGGVGASVPQVVIESGECGRFVLREGVTADNSDDIASGFEIGEKYDLEAGDGSLKMRGLLGVFGASPELLGYRRS
ncbi:hypothetical protein [Curtobacterium sp. MCBD17_021]|uniref:hypothetical protein n=1 Tax=Curtobacterium sp. MCBD17_021 TaxID=2175665 RepID=UPI000DA8DCE9|nr:hypothetical protein [Curtobacterium sp. MCBD17_021]PZE69567.1 hypothetical protein DEI83_00500 [Curtobacterium sp. MCBD17_021]